MMPGNTLEHCKRQWSFLLTLPNHREYSCIVIILTKNFEILSHYPQINSAFCGEQGETIFIGCWTHGTRTGPGQHHVFVKRRKMKACSPWYQQGFRWKLQQRWAPDWMYLIMAIAIAILYQAIPLCLSGPSQTSSFAFSAALPTSKGTEARRDEVFCPRQRT